MQLKKKKKAKKRAVFGLIRSPSFMINTAVPAGNALVAGLNKYITKSGCSCAEFSV